MSSLKSAKTTAMPVDLTAITSPSSDSSRSDLSTVIVIVQEQVKTIPELRKRLSGHNRAFATDLALVGYRIRTGYLFDLIFLKDPVGLFSSLIGALRTNPKTKDYFSSVFHLYEPSSEQSFFVNTALLKQRIKEVHSSEPSRETSSHGRVASSFILLRSPIEILDSAPSHVLQLLNALLPMTTATEPMPSFSLPNDTPFEAAVPLAAVLLDYLVAYVPSSSHHNVLSGTPLDFYECLLTFLINANRNESANLSEDTEVTHSIMKFSCPKLEESGQGKTIGSWLHPQRVVQVLNNIFTERLERIGDLNMRVRIEHTTQIIDHVVF